MSLTDTILIVDDSSFIVEGLVAILKKSYRTLAVYSGQQCLDILIKERPAIIILDIMMEPMDGWETLARIKENPDTRQIPILMFSAKKISAEEAEEHRFSIDEFVSKPVTPKKLIESIEKVLTRQEANRASIELWRSAGISEDRIDAYTSLMRGLEVDISLLQNMKVQLALVREDDDKIRTDLEAVIAAIGGRIEKERLYGEELSREMQESVAWDGKGKERTRPKAPMDESGQESLVREEGTAAAQPERSDFGKSAHGETNPSTTDLLLPEVSVSNEVTVSEITTVPEVNVPESRLSDAGDVPEPAGSGSLGGESALLTSPQKELDMKVAAESPAGEPERDPELSGLPVPAEILNTYPVTLPVSPESSSGSSVIGVIVPVDEKVTPVAEQKIPVIKNPRPFTARTLDNKPVAPDAPLPRAIGSGTDISLGRKPYSVGRSDGSREAAHKEKSVPGNDLDSPPGGFFARIISAILGIFKRQGR